MLDPGVLRIEKERGVGFAGTHDRLNQLSDEFESAGFKIRRYADPERMKWSKLLTNIVANASSAILGWSAGQVFSHPGVARLEIEAMRETLRVMKALGHAPVDLPGVHVSLLGRGLSLPAPIIQNVLKRVVSRGRGKKMPSLYHDIGRHRSEVYWLNGAVVQADPTNNTPANRVLLETMDKLVQDASAANRFHDRPEELLRLAAQYAVPGMPLRRE
jgi:2-dehydropantoate 2-reductase